MILVSTNQWPGNRQELEAAVAAFRDELAAHALTVGIPAPVPRAEIVGRILAEGGLFSLQSEIPADEPPPKTRAEIIDARLAAIDSQSTRPLRAVATGSASAADFDRLAALETQARALRQERATLPPV